MVPMKTTKRLWMDYCVYFTKYEMRKRKKTDSLYMLSMTPQSGHLSWNQNPIPFALVAPLLSLSMVLSGCLVPVYVIIITWTHAASTDTHTHRRINTLISCHIHMCAYNGRTWKISTLKCVCARRWMYESEREDSIKWRAREIVFARGEEEKSRCCICMRVTTSLFPIFTR